MSKMNKGRGGFCARVSWRGQETVASPVAQGAATAAPHQEGVVVIYVQADASVDDAVSRDLSGLMRLLREFAASGVTVQVVDDPAGTGVEE